MKQKLLRLLSMLSIMVLYCSTAGAVAEYQVHLESATTVAQQSFFTVTGPINYNRKYTGTYNGRTYTQGLKMQNGTRITFTTTKSCELVVVQSLAYAPNNLLKIVSTYSDSSSETSTLSKVDNATDNVGVYTVSIKPGTHELQRAGSELGLLFVKVTELSETKVVKPVIIFSEGSTYGSPSTVTISCTTEEASIYYTTDGNTPTTSSTIYEGPFTVNTACTVKAFAVKDGMDDSEVEATNVTINDDRLVSFDFSEVSVTGNTPSNLKLVDNEVYNLYPGKTYFIEGKTQTAWKDAESNEYQIGSSITANKDYVLSPVFVDNTVNIGDGSTTVNWTFSKRDGAPSLAYERKVGYYTQQAIINGKPVDVVMTIDTQTGAAGAGFESTNGKCNNGSYDDRAQVNSGTVFKIPAVKGMQVAFTKTVGTFDADAVSFNGENGTVSDNDMTYTYAGDETVMTIVVNQSGLYPSKIKVDYPADPKKDATLSGITVNGTALAGFSSTTYAYNHELPALTVNAPVVAATANNPAATVSITQAESTEGTATISVTSVDGSTKNEYVINFSVKPASTDATLNQVVFSNTFDAFINNSESGNTITAYYLEGTDEPTISKVNVAEFATYSVSGDVLTVTAQDGTTSVNYKLIVKPVSPYVGFDRTFDGTESWVKNGYGFDAADNRGYKFSKTDTDNSRERDGRTRVYFFVGAYQTVYIYTASGITSDRDIKVYVNGVQQTSITTAPKYSSSGTAKIDVTIGGTPSMVAVVSNQTKGDGGFGSIVVAGLENPTKTIGISASHGYTSYCSEYALDFTDVKALEAYVASAAANGVVSMKNVQKVPAKTGLVLKSTSGAAVSDVQVPVIESADAVGANLLVGTVAATTVEPSSDTNGYNYLFGTKNDVLGFYKLITNTFEMPANKAYLHTAADVTPASNGAKGVIMDFGNGETTAISNIDADADNNAIYYNLNGQRVVNPGKGLYILNGKKVMVK